MKGFSRTNLLYMRAFADAYPEEAFVQQVVGQIPWGHNVRILERILGTDTELTTISKLIRCLSPKLPNLNFPKTSQNFRGEVIMLPVNAPGLAIAVGNVMSAGDGLAGWGIVPVTASSRCTATNNIGYNIYVPAAVMSKLDS